MGPAFTGHLRDVPYLYPPFLGTTFLWYLSIVFCHELLHAMAWWYFGEFAIPIPILIPPILGICIGPKLDRGKNIVISLAPVLITTTGVLLWFITKQENAGFVALFNLVGMAYDIFSAIRG